MNFHTKNSTGGCIFISSNNFVFQQLPELNVDYKEQVNKFRGPFSGDPNKILIQVQKQQGEPKEPVPKPSDVDSDDEMHKVKKVIKNFTELERLAFVVQTIQNECQTIPVGAVKMNIQHELRVNSQFSGLSKEQAAKLSNYQHFRAAQSIVARNNLNKPESVFSFKFLDPISEDEPSGCWSIRSDFYQQNFTIRSLVWPGYMGYVSVKSNIFGGVYFGEGIKNTQLCFYL